jgi:uncharacterized membrane protein
MKYLVAPTAMPDELTWFKWEAYTTWLSGFTLMVVVCTENLKFDHSGDEVRPGWRVN